MDDSWVPLHITVMPLLQIWAHLTCQFAIIVHVICEVHTVHRVSVFRSPWHLNSTFWHLS